MFDNKETRLLKNTVIYTISNFGSKILTFLIVPLYTYYLTTSEYGTYDTVISILSLVTPLCILAINEGLLRWLLGSYTYSDRSKIITTGGYIYLSLLSVVEIILLVTFRIADWQYGAYFIVLLVGSTMQTVLQFVARGLRRNKVFAVSGVLYTIVMLSLNLLCVIALKMNIDGMFISIIVAHFVSDIYIIISISSDFSFKPKEFDKFLAKDMSKYSILLVPNNISWWIINVSDRLMITYMIGASANGIYAIACKFPSIVAVLHTIFYQAWQEQAVLEYESEDRDAFYTKIFNIYMRLSLCSVLILIPLSKWIIIHFMDVSYQSGYIYIGILYLGSIFSSFSGFFGTGYISAKDTKSAMITTMIGAIVNVVINLAFIPTFGIWAACISTLMGYLVVWIIRIIQTRKYFTINVDWKCFVFLLVANTLYSSLISINNDVLLYAMIVISFVVFWIINLNTVKSVSIKMLNKVEKRKYKK